MGLLSGGPETLGRGHWTASQSMVEGEGRSSCTALWEQGELQFIEKQTSSGEEVTLSYYFYLKEHSTSSLAGVYSAWHEKNNSASKGRSASQ